MRVLRSGFGSECVVRRLGQDGGAVEGFVVRRRCGVVRADVWQHVPGCEQPFALDGISCNSAEPAVPLPSRLFELCPSLEQKAKAQCPKGTFREWCLVGAGLTCQDLSIENARDTAALFGGRWGDAGIAPRTTTPLSNAAAASEILNKDTTLAGHFADLF